MLTNIPAEIWNSIAEEGNLRTEWGRKAFMMDERQMEDLETKESDELEKKHPRLVVRGFQDARPFLLEREAIQAWLQKNGRYATAFPEICTPQEGAAIARTDWMLDDEETKQVEELLEQALRE